MTMTKISNTGLGVTGFRTGPPTPATTMLPWLELVARPAVPDQDEWATFWRDVGRVGLWAVVVLGSYKVLQAVFDTEYEGRFLPAYVRDELIAEHLEHHGGWCPGWKRSAHQVRWCDLTVDHIIASANGGRTSIANSQVLCRSCNAAKGKTNSVLDRLRGR